MTWTRSVAAAGAIALIAAAAVAPPAAARDGATNSIVPISRAEAKQRPKLRMGSRGIWVRRLHRALHITPAAQPFGRATAHAVRQFRVSVGMRPRPIVNTRTWMRLGSLVVVGRGKRRPPPVVSDRPVLRRGDTSAWVSALQVALGVEPVTGYFGPITERAVREFQAGVPLPVTGVVDARTWTALGDRVTPPPTDVTTTEEARTSRAYRASIGVRAFATSATALMVIQRESGGQCDIVSPSGTYRGKWQMDRDFWSAYGGPEFAPRPDLASCGQQDRVAYRGWIDRWWQPWPTAIP